MRHSHPRLRPLSLAIAGFVFAAGSSLPAVVQGHVAIDESGQGFGPVAATADHAKEAQYIVRFKELPLALYDGRVPGLASIPRAAEPGHRAKLNTRSQAALAYVSYLRSLQTQHVGDINSLLGRSLAVERQMQHALNAVVVTLTPDDAKKIAALDSVAGVEREVYQQLTTDLGPGFIGAANIWWGADAGVDTLFAASFDSNPQYRGEGVVIADIDTGYNSNSPSFAGTDDSGYVFINPLGSGNYLGLCNPSYPEQPSTLYTVPFAGCNDKVIGAYDLITSSAGPIFSAEDFQGHGSHTGSTAAGNARTATTGAYSARLSGVAPRSNMVIYYACGALGCPTSSTSAAVDQAIQDAVVDSLNYSISGGTDPWTDATSLAFLSATDAGIFVAAAAGNTNTSVPVPLPGTANHLEPWVTTVAAANHTGGPLGYFLTASVEGAPPPTAMNTAPASTQPIGPIATTLAVSPNFGNANDCSTFPSGIFTGKLAILHFVNGPCNTDALAAKALAAGAAQVLLVNSTDDYINSGAAQALPVFTTTSVQGNALVAFVNSNPGATATISYPANARVPVTADSLATFSLLGPAVFDVIKPDVQAPGVSILAAFNNARSSGASLGADNIAFEDGTSMATPHTTGSAGLLMGLHPDWTPMEVKSALMMTAKETGLTKPDHVTLSDFYDRGSGRIQDDRAAKAGLVLNETGLKFVNANPATGGDPKTLNLASMQNINCVTVTGPSTSTPTCAFARKFHSTQGRTITWSASITGVNGTVTPSSFSVAANGTRSVNITVDASAYASDSAPHFGELILTPEDADSPELHLPIAVALQPPAIAAVPTALSMTIPNASTTHNSPLVVKNTGGPTLYVTNTNDNASLAGHYVVLDQPIQGNFGDYSDYFTNFAQGIYDDQGIYDAEDFATSAASTDLTQLTFSGFQLGEPLHTGNKIHFEIYADNAGEPKGNPETAAPSYVWNFVATVGTTAGLSVAGSISIDLTAAGAPATALAPGRYWVTVYPELNWNISRWVWFESTATFGYNAHVINPKGIFAIGNAWLDMTDPMYGNTFPGMALHVEAKVPCGAAWLSTSPPNLAVSGLTSAMVTVTADSTLFPVPGPGTATGVVCLDSNDAKFPILAVPVTATQN